MKQRILNPVLIFILLFLTLCSRQDPSSVLEEVPFKDGKLTKIFIERISPEVREIKLSELITDFQVIPLETREECLVMNTNIEFGEDFILVGTQHSMGPAKVYKFDYQGRFIDEVGSPGRGPGGHVGWTPDVIHCYDDHQRILVKWTGKSEDPQLFDFQGSVVEEIDQPYRLLRYIERFSDSVWISPGIRVDRPKFSKDSMALVFFNKEGKILKRIPRRNYPPKNSRGYSPRPLGVSPTLYQYKDQWKFYLNGNDTLFAIEEDMNLTPVGVLVPGKEVLPFNEIITPSQSIDKYSLGILAETKGNWYINKAIIKKADMRQYKPGQWGGQYSTKDLLIVINKKSKEATYARLTDDLFHLFKGNMPLKWQNNRIFFALPPIHLKKLVKEVNLENITNQKAKEVIEMIREMPEDDNPVIFSFRLKDRFKL